MYVYIGDNPTRHNGSRGLLTRQIHKQLRALVQNETQCHVTKVFMMMLLIHVNQLDSDSGLFLFNPHIFVGHSLN